MAKLALIARHAFPAANGDQPRRWAIGVCDGMRAAVQADRSQSNKDATTPYYSANRPGANVPESVRENYRR